MSEDYIRSDLAGNSLLAHDQDQHKELTDTLPFTVCGEVALLVSWTVPLATAAGSEKGSCTAAAG